MSAENTSEIDLPAIDDLDAAIASLSARIDAACYEQLVLIRQFDQRGGWLKWAFPNCTEWLAWRCDLSLSAAREKVRVAHALMTLPTITSTFAAARTRRLAKPTAHMRAERCACTVILHEA